MDGDEVTYEGKPFEFIRSSRRHRVGRAHAWHVMSTVEPLYVPRQPGELAAMLYWSGMDDRGIEFEIVASERPDAWLVIHVMPTHYRD